MPQWLKLVTQVLTPGNPELKAHVLQLRQQEHRLLQCLQILEDSGIREVTQATDSASTF